MNPMDDIVRDNLYRLTVKYNVVDLAKVIFDDYRFFIWSGSSKPYTHHYGPGKLALHTLEVVELCLSTNDQMDRWGKKVDEQSLFLAALFHDVGKMWDYEPVSIGWNGKEGLTDYKDWQSTRHKRQIYHLPRSAIVWSHAMKDHGYSDPEDQILHAILAHHGQKDYGSPVTPQTRMAWILHLCDSISARLDDCYNEKPHG